MKQNLLPQIAAPPPATLPLYVPQLLLQILSFLSQSFSNMKKLFTHNSFARGASMLCLCLLSSFALYGQCHLSGDVNGFSTTSDLLTATGGASSITKTGISGSNTFKIGYNTWSIDFSKGSAANFNQTETWFQPNGGNTSATFTASNYYTFNWCSVSGSTGNKAAGIMQTTFNPTAISSVVPNTTSPPPAAGVTVTVTMAAAPQTGENVFIRYSANINQATAQAFSATTAVQVTFPAGSATGTAFIPAQIANTWVYYYAYSSTRTLAQINTDVTTFGQTAHDATKAPPGPFPSGRRFCTINQVAWSLQAPPPPRSDAAQCCAEFDRQQRALALPKSARTKGNHP